MATFEAQVEALTSLSIDGSSAPTQTELTQFLTDGAKEVINSMPKSLKYFCATEDSFTSTAVGSEVEAVTSGDVLQVTRSDGTINQSCIQIPAQLSGRASDSNDIVAATATNPVYYVYNGKLNALPASGSCKYLEINRPTVAYGDSSIGTVLTGVTATAADPTVFTKSSHGLVDGDTVHLSGFTEMTEINGMTGTVNQLDANTFEVNGVAADPAETTGGSVVKGGLFPDEAEYLVPLYAAIKALQNKMGSKSSELPSDITFPVVPAAPSAPSFTTPNVAGVTVSNVGTPPTYTVPSITSTTGSPNDLSDMIDSDWSSLDYDFDDENIDFATWFQVVGDYIQNQEDPELAQAQLQKITTYIQAYSTAMQNQLNVFNDANEEYKGKLQEAIKQADINAQEAQQEANLKLQKETQEYSQKLSKLQAEVVSYQHKVGEVVQDFNAKLQKHSTDYQWLQSQYQQLSAEYARGLQLLIGGGISSGR